MIADVYERPEWADDPIGRQWWDFNLANPAVLARLISLCMDWLEVRPGERVSMKMLWERLRWETAVGDATADYRLNNNYTSLYARWVLVLRPEWDGLFETRERRCDVVADKPDPIMFTAYKDCPFGRCVTVGECRRLGQCRETCDHVVVRDVTLEGEVTRVWCPRCDSDLTDENEEVPHGGSN